MGLAHAYWSAPPEHVDECRAEFRSAITALVRERDRMRPVVEAAMEWERSGRTATRDLVGYTRAYIAATAPPSGGIGEG
jgi:hypothetical protein